MLTILHLKSLTNAYVGNTLDVVVCFLFLLPLWQNSSGFLHPAVEQGMLSYRQGGSKEVGQKLICNRRMAILQ
jgi:hypothetical protein